MMSRHKALSDGSWRSAGGGRLTGDDEDDKSDDGPPLLNLVGVEIDLVHCDGPGLKTNGAPRIASMEDARVTGSTMRGTKAVGAEVRQ